MAALGGLVGALAGMALLVAIWLDGHPDETAREVTREVLAAPLAPPTGFFTLAGAMAGFLVTGGLVRNRLVGQILLGFRRVLWVLLGGAAGVALGAAAYVAFRAASGPDHSVRDALAQAASALGNPGDPALTFLLAGLLAGLAGTAYAVGRGLVRTGARLLAGAAAGGLAGLAMYSVAFALLFYPALPGRSADLFRLAQAVYSFTPTEFLSVGLGALCGALLSSYSWRLYGLLTFLSLLFVVLGYTLYTATQTLPGVPPEGLLLSQALFAAEIASLVMVLLYSFYTIDVAARKHWRRTTLEATFSSYYLPKVAIHVPTFNEPPELVEATLRTLLDLDYPPDRHLILVGDDSTDPECAGPLRQFCEAHGIVYLHRDDRTGYKAGALNALLLATPADANLIAVVDADYQVAPEFLRETVGYFVDPELGWLQTPQDYRNRGQSFLTEQYYLADAYFYRTILPSRNEENSIIFCGTMGMVRRRAVVEVGGWGEKYITEDAELSARLLNAGWRSLYVNKTYGRGLIPPTFEGYKRQHYRWAFGGGRILRGYGLRFLFGRFTFRQRLDYLVGTLNWFEGAFIFAIALFVLAMGAADLAGVDVVTHHSNEILLVGLVPLFLLLDGLTRVHLVLRKSVHLGFGGTLRILGMWFSVKFSNMRAALKALVGFSIPFVRTPKAPSERVGRWRSLAYALRITAFESTMAVLLAATALGELAKLALGGGSPDVPPTASLFLVFWLLYYTIVFTAAPLYAYKSFSTLQPEIEEPETVFTEVPAPDVNA